MMQTKYKSSRNHETDIHIIPTPSFDPNTHPRPSPPLPSPSYCFSPSTKLSASSLLTTTTLLLLLR